MQDDEGAYGVDNAACLSERVVEDLSNGLIDRRGEDSSGIAHAIAEDDVEQETGNIGEQHGKGDGPRCLELRLGDSVRVSICFLRVLEFLTPQ